MTVEVFDIKPDNDHIARQAKAHPVQALSELIWNALDADATEVAIEIDEDKLGGIAKIFVQDNGHGMPRDEAANLFGKLGGSWKRMAMHTKARKRMLHGKEGRGRFKAFALADTVDWTVVYDKAGIPKKFDITILEREIGRVRITEETDCAGATSGVTVKLSELKGQFSVLKTENAVQDLAEIFAIYLKNYRDVTISYRGEKIDPALAIQAEWEFSLSPLIDEQGMEHPVTFEIIEWRQVTRRALYLCNAKGFPLSQVDSRFRVGDFQFSAYLKSTAIENLHQDGRLDLAEMLPVLQASVNEAKEKIKELFRERAAARTKDVVEEWKEKNLYPFEGEPASPLEQAERRIFDIVAVTVQDASPDFEGAAPKQLALHLRLLRNAIEQSPAELQRILEEVLKLPKPKQKELAQLLDETDLSGVISAAKLVADRLKFIDALKFILFDYEAKKKLKERSQLHKILEQNTWIFGEEYHLWASDKDLTNVLKIHKAKLDSEIIIDEPVQVIGKSRGIVDLMLSRSQRRHRANDIEHLVVELKAPKVVLGAKDMMQIEGYALAVEKDARFNGVQGLKWHFWLVSDEYDEAVEARIQGSRDPRRRLITERPGVSVGVKTWGEIIAENQARLQFIKEALEHRADDGQALAFLQDRHGELLEGVIVEDADNENVT
jgi:hypothetical protein